MNSYRKLEFKSYVFDGYCVWFDLEKYSTKASLINAIKNHLLNFLKTFNLKALQHYANKTELYCDEAYEDCNDMVNKTTPDTTIYVFERSTRN